MDDYKVGFDSYYSVSEDRLKVPDMKNEITRRELKARYLDREVVGGVFLIQNKVTGRSLLDSSLDIKGSKNRFEFAQSTGSCVIPRLQSDWDEHGGSSFVFKVLELLTKSGTQTKEEFKADIVALKEMWYEKLDPKNLY